jgi:putative membrane protein
MQIPNPIPLRALKLTENLFRAKPHLPQGIQTATLEVVRMKLNIALKHLVLGCAVLGLSGFLFAQTGSQSTAASGKMAAGSGTASATMSTSDKDFMKKAAEGDLAEVELGSLAEKKANNPDVKKFAERMVTDHTKANDELKEVASSKGMTLPHRLSVKDEAAKQKLSALSGDQFDKAYMSDMLKDHMKDVGDFQRECSTASDPAVKHFAMQTLPTLRDHLKEAKNIAPQVAR